MGSTYMTQQAFLELSIPVALQSIFENKFKSYLKALKNKDPLAMRSIEKKARHALVSKTEKKIKKDHGKWSRTVSDYST